MKNLWLVVVMLLVPSLCKGAGKVVGYRSLDSSQPIEFLGDRIRFNGEEILLGEKAFFVDGLLTDELADRYPYVFNSFAEAVGHLKPGSSEADRMTVYLAPCVYWIDDPDDTAVRMPKKGDVPFGMEIFCPWLKLQGLTDNPANVVLASNRGQTQGAVGNYTMFFFHGDGISLNNLTLGNYCNVDLDFPLEPSLNCSKRMPAVTQAQLAFADGDKLEAHNVHFISRLNLCPLNGGKRTLFEKCYFECTDDALCGTGVYLDCDFVFYGSKPFYATSETGAVFLDCDVYSKCGARQYITKVESPMALVDCHFHFDGDVYLGWTQDPSSDLRCYQSGVTCNGRPVVLSEDVPQITVDMTGKPLLDAYKFELDGKTVYNTYNLLSGDDGWDPLAVKPLVEEGEKQTGRRLSGLPVYLGLVSTGDSIQQGGKPLEVQADVKRWGGYAYVPSSLEWNVSDPRLLGIMGDVFDIRKVVTGTNVADSTMNALVLARTSSGLCGAAEIVSMPSYLPAPEFDRKPWIKKKEGGVLKVCYKLGLEGRKDESLITWYRCKDSSGKEAVKVAVSRLDSPEYTYTLRPGDIGCYIKAVIQPKHRRCLPGKAVTAIYKKRIDELDVPDTKTYETDFRNFPAEYQPYVKPGYWTVDGYKPMDTSAYSWEPTTDSWYYGKGFDAAKGTGLMQKAKGARLLYTPLSGEYGDMDVTLKVDPCKQAGQGFGSATGQYMDVYIKFDTRTLSGYALRIFRTTKYHKAVDFQLVRYDHGKVEALGKPVSATCYRTGCTIRLWTEKGNKLFAHVETQSEQPETNDPNLMKVVDLQSDISPNFFGGTGIQHTGSTGASATMLHGMKIKWN
ncbi:hypothetical protein [uncultured Bacteroides sp.]|uniref:hypothetical protein n=1 Tax=uncultured Bacteroides sp. TaxID=162156 RepID=UPI002612033F|nr:hypothetical protein [uncultured Bacteroides sp.]